MSFVGKPPAHLLDNDEKVGQFINCFSPFAFSCFV